MLFNLLQYAVFLPIVFILYWVIPIKYRWALLLIASYYLYMSWNAEYVFLILFTTIISYCAGILLEKSDNKKQRNLVLLVTTLACFSVLFVFKYFNFFFDTLSALCGLFMIWLSPITLRLLCCQWEFLFIPFKTFSYVVDVYRRDAVAEKYFGIYATFISFFP